MASLCARFGAAFLGLAFAAHGCAARAEQRGPAARREDPVNRKESTKLSHGSLDGGTARGCPEGMVYVPGGTFMMGEKPNDEIAPLHKVTITKAYCIDRLEATVGEYRECEKAKQCTKSGAHGPGYYGRSFYCNEKLMGREKHPINCITWLQADAYCRFLSKRLPTEAEWELAARGPQSFRFPWGDQPPSETLAWNSMYTIANRDHAKCADMGSEICPKVVEHAPRGTTEVGRHLAGASPFGALDMGGNVSEWVQDWDHRISSTDAVDPIGVPTGSERVIKDISWASGLQSETMAAHSGGRPETAVYDSVGVRCARPASR